MYLQTTPPSTLHCSDIVENRENLQTYPCKKILF
jgi:hypothetical protein